MSFILWRKQGLALVQDETGKGFYSCLWVPPQEGSLLVCLQPLSFFIAGFFFFVIPQDLFDRTNLKQRAFLTSDSKGNGTKCHRGPPLADAYASALVGGG